MAKYLKLLALLAAAAFAAIAIYINLVEQPSRLVLEDRALLAQWAASYPRAMVIQASLAILGGLCAVGAWYFSRDWLWLVGAVLMLANWPYTMFVIYPVNEALFAMAAGSPAQSARATIEQWGWLHAARSALGSVATVLFVLAMSRDARLTEAHAK